MPPATTNRVLIVEENPELAAQQRHRLEGAGHTVLTTSTAEGALTLMRQQPVDLILAAHQLHGFDGLAFLSESKSAGLRPAGHPGDGL